LADLKSQLELMMLQLQRSALIDTQTLFQLLIEKEICTLDEITSMRNTVESNNGDVRRLDQQIAELKGEPYRPPLSISNKSELVNQLRKLLQSELNSLDSTKDNLK